MMSGSWVISLVSVFSMHWESHPKLFTNTIDKYDEIKKNSPDVETTGLYDNGSD